MIQRPPRAIGRAAGRAHRLKPARPSVRDSEQGPPRSDAVVPLPRSERGGRREAPQGEPQTSSLQQNPSDRKSTRLNSSHSQISYAVFCLKKKKKNKQDH